MLKAVVLVATIACLSQQALTGTVKRKRQSGFLGEMEDYTMEDYEDMGSGVYEFDGGTDDLVLYFHVTYDKPFEDEWLELGSSEFLEEASRVESSIKDIIHASLAMELSEITVEVVGFWPGSTKAEILVRIPNYYTEEDVVESLKSTENYGDIDGARILKVEEVMDEVPYYEDGDGPRNEAIILELTWEYDTSDLLDLDDLLSENFLRESESLTNQLILLVTAKLAADGVVVTDDQIKISVLGMTSQDSYTTAELSVQGEGIDIERLSLILQLLTIDRDVRIDNLPIVSINEISRDFFYTEGDYDPDTPDMHEEVMMKPHDPLNGYDANPSDDGEPLPEIEGEVMHDKEDTLNGERPPDLGESIPPDDTVIPGLTDVPPSRGDGGFFDPSSSTLNDEPVPPDDDDELPPMEETIPTDEERVPPADDEPIPPDEEQYCEKIEEPEFGEMSCTNDNMMGSRCHFYCDEDTRMEGPDTITCDGGRWNTDPPVCRRIFCEPDDFILRRMFTNGEVDCNRDNLFESVCMFVCHDEYQLVGPKAIRCQRSQKWSDAPPFCEPAPVYCEEEYGEWSECDGGIRSKESVTVLRGGVTTVCDQVTEVCVDCQLDWRPWSECDADMRRHREEYVAVERTGAGQECPEPGIESENCRDCIIDWADWPECSDGTRTRKQYIAQTPIGLDECPPLDEETQVCIDCVMEWDEWSECIDGLSIRSETISVAALNGGEACPRPRLEEEACFDCEAVWEDWSTCENGETTRSQYVATKAIGRGQPCTLEEEREACQNCRVAWSGWSACSNGGSSRQMFVVQQPLGQGDDCPSLDAEVRACANCRLEWGDWEACIEGERQRSQYVAEVAEGAGNPCDEPEVEFKDCANCLLDWEPWSECSDDVRSRWQYVVQEPQEVDEECPELKYEEEPCIDCAYTWGEWGECQFGLQRRYLTVDVESAGAGAACPEEQSEAKECCYLEWLPWSDCTDGTRTRFQEVLVAPEGVDCPEPRVDTEICVHCVLEWGPWSECQNFISTRTQIVVQEARGAGDDCVEVQTETDECADCVVQWGPWSICEDDLRVRMEEVVEDPTGVGRECPELDFEEEACVACEWEWSEWSECENEQRSRSVSIIRNSEGAGEACPATEDEYEVCVDCVVEWGDWSECQDGESFRDEYIAVQRAGAGRECAELQTEHNTCVDCLVGWEEWSECADGGRKRNQYIVTPAEGVGKECPDILGMVREDCVDCVLEWGLWGLCFNDVERRKQQIVQETIGAGLECPPLDMETRECKSDKKDREKTICRFVDIIVGWKRRPAMRDLLLIGDESGSIGWVNFEKIKENFKSIAKNIRGGLGLQGNQIAMSSFARYSRAIFDFDDYYNPDDLADTIDEVIYKGGFRSRIGGALSDANTWMFQQSGGMRSFPSLDDSIDHEILIATDGCRTFDVFHLKQGLKALKRRGIKLYVLAVAAKDERCQETVKSMVDDNNDLFELETWDDLDEMTRIIREGVCVKSADKEESEDESEDEDESDESESDSESESETESDESESESSAEEDYGA